MASNSPSSYLLSPEIRSAVRLQLLSAVLVGLAAVPFAIASVAMGVAVCRGDWPMLVPLLIVASITGAAATLSASLFRGRGVPQWIMQLFWLGFVAGIAGFLAAGLLAAGLRQTSTASSSFGGLVMVGTLSYFAMATFRTVWLQRSK